MKTRSFLTLTLGLWVGTASAYDSLPSEIDAKCDREPMQRALVTAHLFGIEAVPFLIAPDGRTFKGAPENLTDWLDDKPAPSGTTTISPKTEAKP